MNFEQYILTEDLKRVRDVMVVIWKNGCISICNLRMPPGVSGLSPGTRVVLFYSAQRKVIGIKPIKDQCEYSPIKSFGSPKYPKIRCKPFLDHNKIPYPTTVGVHAGFWTNLADMLMIQVRDLPAV